MNNPMLGRPMKPGAGNPMARYARGYSKPNPGASTPDRRYKTDERTPVRAGPPRPPAGGRGFVEAYMNTMRRELGDIGGKIGRAAGVALAMEPAARALRGVGNRAALQSVPESRGKFLQRVYADQQMPAGDMPLVRAITGRRSPFAAVHGAGFDRAMNEFQRTHKWARQAKNKTDVEFAVNYLLSKKHKRYYNP